MSGFIEGEDRRQATLFPECIDDYIAEDSPVRVIDVFVDNLDLSGLGLKTIAEATGRPGYHPATLLKLFIYGYLNRVQSSRRLEHEAIVETRENGGWIKSQSVCACADQPLSIPLAR